MKEESEENKNASAQVQQEICDNFTLPAWRMTEIIDIVAEILHNAEYYADGFDYVKMINAEGIKIKGFSEFYPENLEKMKVFSRGFWKEGLCIVIPPDEENRNGMKMICYNDSYKNTEVKMIIFHEFAHIILKHTEQSIIGEIEATCFAASMLTFLVIEERFHFARTLAETGNLNRLMGITKGGVMK